jgi:hypothetical protein
MEMLQFVASLFGCAHRNRTFPITDKSRASEDKAGRTYVVCLDCGKEFSYDWQRMKVGGPARPASAGAKRANVA